MRPAWRRYRRPASPDRTCPGGAAKGRPAVAYLGRCVSRLAVACGAPGALVLCSLRLGRSACLVGLCVQGGSGGHGGRLLVERRQPVTRALEHLIALATADGPEPVTACQGSACAPSWPPTHTACNLPRAHWAKLSAPPADASHAPSLLAPDRVPRRHRPGCSPPRPPQSRHCKPHHPTPAISLPGIAAPCEPRLPIPLCGRFKIVPCAAPGSVEPTGFEPSTSASGP